MQQERAVLGGEIEQLMAEWETIETELAEI
jgi:hypothetical protein